MSSDAKKLLDSLMGQTRNLDLKEAKKKKGNNFKESNCCKFYLLGFCPQHEELFRNTKRHLGECGKIHSIALKEEFEAHAERESYEIKYVRDLVKYMEGIVRTADDAVSRQGRNIVAANKELEERGPNDVAKREIMKIRENCNLLLNEAEELAEKGDVEGSKMKQAIFEQTKQKADDYEEKSKQPIKEEVCDVCGLRPEDGDGMRKFSHTEGKIHQGFVKVREWLAKMRARSDELGIGPNREDSDRRSKSRDRKNRSRSKGREDRKDKGEKKEGEEETNDKEPTKDGAKASEEQPGDKETPAEKEPRKGDRDEPGRDRDRRDDRGDRGRGSDRDGDRRDRDRRGGERRGDDRGSRGGGDRRDDRDRGRGDRDDEPRQRRNRSRSRDRRH